MKKIFMGAVAVAAISIGGLAALAQQGNDQVHDLQIQLSLTQQQLTKANSDFVNERSSTIRLGRQLNEALSDNVKAKAESDKKDGQIKEITDKAAGVEAATKAASAKCDKELQEAVKPPVCVSHPIGSMTVTPIPGEAVTPQAVPMPHDGQGPATNETGVYHEAPR